MSRKKSLLTYTVLYALLAAAVWGWFLLAGKSFVCDADAYEQHINALMLYGRWLRACPGALIASLREGRGFVLPGYSFGIGYGADLYTSLQYYCVGDPLNLPLALIPTKFVYLYYHFLILLRPYLAGLAFIAMSSYLRERQEGAVTAGTVAGALVYAFSGTVLFIGMWNPFFTAPMILLPLLILTAVRILDGKSPVPFILTVFLAGVTNFYFFYMLVLLTAGYVILFLLTDRKEGHGLPPAEVLKQILRFLAYGITGTLMSMAVLLPVALAFLSNPRAGLLEHGVLPFYEPAYYKELLVNLTSYIYHPLYDTELCLTFIAVPALVFLFLRFRRNRRTCVLLLVCLAMLLIPAAGYVMGGLSYMINRWCFAAGLAVSYAAGLFIDGAADMTKKEKGICAAVSALYAVCTLLAGGTDSIAAAAQILLLAAACVLLIAVRRQRLVSIALTAAVLCGIVCNGYAANAPGAGNLPGGFVDAAGAEAFYEQYQSNEVLALEQVTGTGDSEFIRYTGRNLIWNSPLLKGISSTQFYWSLANGAIAQYLQEMAVNEMADYSYFGLDDRVPLLALSGTDYYTLRYQTPEEAAYVPAGFTKAGDYYNFGVFRNAVPLGAGYVCTAMIPEAAYAAMTPAMRQEALMQGVVTAGDRADLPEAEPVYAHTVCAVRTEPGEGVTDTGHSFEVTEPGAVCRVSFEGAPQSETMLYVRGLRYDGEVSAMNIQVRDCTDDGEDAAAGVTKYIAYKTPRSQFYSGWHDYLVNLCYHEAPRTAAEIVFPAAGTYHYEEISAVCQPIAPYFEHLVGLVQGREIVLDLHKDGISHTTSRVTGQVTAMEDGFLVLTIPWQQGWTCLVDGAEVPLLQADTMFMGTGITAGNHTVELIYRTPGLKTGVLLSITGVMLCLAVFFAGRRKRKAAAG